MARIELRALAHSYVAKPAAPADYAVKPLDLIWEDAGAYALLGPSGCGKSTLLGIMSGLIKPSAGSVWIDGRDVTELDARARNVAQVFQFPVVYDTMSVFENLAFPLRNRGVSRAETRSRVQHIAELLELTPELARKASGLPGDLKQRISLGRGLVRKDVAAVLLDEPLTIIDPHLKWLLRRKLIDIHAELRVTLIYVTHDQMEALTLADQVVVMKDGDVLQRGTPQELFEHPAHTFVGHFIGSPGMNVLPCAIDADGGAHVGGATIALSPRLRDAARGARGELALGVRPEFLRLVAAGTGEAMSADVLVTELAQLGAFQIAGARMGQLSLQVKLSSDAQITSGVHYRLEFPEPHTHLYADGRVLT
jgi:glycerol transport system ATP-binding protein